MSEVFGDRKAILKDLIRRLHEGEDPVKIKEEFRKILEGVSPAEIARIEGELIEEGFPPEEIHRLCDVHIEMFREALEKGKPPVPEWHPVYILMEEHSRILNTVAEGLRRLKEKFDRDHLAHLVKHLNETEVHYVREENVLFPYLERHGIVQPPKIMWMEHDRIREIKRELNRSLDADPQRILEILSTLETTLRDHYYKENNILFPAGLEVITDPEWAEIRREFDELGYCCYTPPEAPLMEEERPVEGGAIRFETGELTPEVLEAILDTIPMEITFVDADDTVRYFNRSEERFFPRTKAILGRKVQNCHPQKSIDIVNRIIREFRSGERDVAEFWIDFRGRKLHIRYFAVRDKRGEYLGVLEATQDITDIMKIRGEKRLLDLE